MKYGLTIEEWDNALDDVRSRMIEVAKLGTTITYGDLAAHLTTISPHPGAYVFHALLRAVCYEEDQAGRGMLCAVVVSKATGIPGQGFFKAMIKQGRDCTNPCECWQAELAYLYDVWAE